MDSVLKNVTAAGNYKEHIEKTIHQVFVHVFEMGDERTRSALHKLRQTWTGIFQRSTLYKIDLAVHAIDPAWPVVTPQPISAAAASSAPPQQQQQVSQPQQQQQHPRASPKVHVNPHFFQKTVASTANATTSGAAAPGAAAAAAAASASNFDYEGMMWMKDFALNPAIMCLTVHQQYAHLCEGHNYTLLQITSEIPLWHMPISSHLKLSLRVSRELEVLVLALSRSADGNIEV
ncbi:unnamed protein product [Gongylonema pulchrum]|uniref:CID domain-containing protein n=1 Tax=Gongylonema pulchrum TaxID=637853 RepID=A0A183EBC4_9BILA|nr:unnamed protein product [Gongylonema pulchrum]